MLRTLRAALILTFTALAVMVPRTSAFAGQYIDPLTLNPPAVPPYTCMATGSGAICSKDMPLDDGPGPSGIFCGSSQNPVELIGVDSGTQEATRYYDTAGDLVRRHLRDTYVGTFTNPLTGAYVAFDQLIDEEDDLSVPGDFNSGTVTFTGPTRVHLHDGGIVLIDTGRDLTLPDGTVEQSSGQHPFDQYFLYGNAAAFEPICAAVGAPQSS